MLAELKSILTFQQKIERANNVPPRPHTIHTGWCGEITINN